jgi:hypothetical protein
MIARSRTPLAVVASRALSKACVCRSDSQLPTRMPCDLGLMPGHRGSQQSMARQLDPAFFALGSHFGKISIINAQRTI